NGTEHADQTRDGSPYAPKEDPAQSRQADRGGKIAERVGDVGPEPGRRRNDAGQRARHLGRRDHGEAVDDSNSTKQFERGDDSANKAELKDAHADHHTPSAFFDSSRGRSVSGMAAAVCRVSAAFAIRAVGASLRQAGLDRSACPSRTAL